MRNTSKIKLLSIYLKRMVFQLFLWVQTVGYLATRATPLVSASQPIIGQGEYFVLFASFINYETLPKDDVCSNLIK